MRKGNWMQTASGKQFWPIDPLPEEIDINDIASALSKTCRYGGHCMRFYSVAEHCVHVAAAAPEELKLVALLHDASEAYLSDIVRPIKPHLGSYLIIEAALERCIAKKYNLIHPWPDIIKRLDNGILGDERDQNMAPPPASWDLTDPKLGVTLQYWSPDEAKVQFLEAFEKYK